jgi:hypothetical protein
MIALTSLWLPILLSAVFVFIASSIIHMFLGYHADDFGPTPDEERVRDALRGIPPGDYVVPYAKGMDAMKTPEYTQKMQEGPAAFITVGPSGDWSMGRSLGLWFVYCLVVSHFAGYVAGRALGFDAHYLEVFRFAGATAFIGYAMALWQGVIWYRRSVRATLKSTFDGLIFALLTAGTFGWLWPSM